MSKKESIRAQLFRAYGENVDSGFLKLAFQHLTTLDTYTKAVHDYGPRAFPNRHEYQKFAVAKLFVDKLDVLNCKPDPPLEGFDEFIDEKTPPIENFHMTNDEKDIKRIKFCMGIDKGDVLHLKIISESETEYRLLVLNKYGERERVIDYSVYAFLIKAYHLERLANPLKVSDLLRATVLGKLKIEERTVSKLLVSINPNVLSEKNRGIQLGPVLKEDIPFYPEDVSKYSSCLEYIIHNKPCKNSKDLVDCIASLGVDPYTIHSFYEPVDGKKLGTPSIVDIKSLEKEMMEKSMTLTMRAETFCKESDFQSAFFLLDEALKAYPKNDLAYALKGQIYKSLWALEGKSSNMKRAIKEFKKALVLNSYNQIARRECNDIYSLSLQRHEQELQKLKSQENAATSNNTVPVREDNESITVKLEIGHTAREKEQPSREGYTHDWTVFVCGHNGSKLEHFVKKIVFHLPDNFPKSRRVKKHPPYLISESSYAAFLMTIDVYFDVQETQVKTYKYDIYFRKNGVNNLRVEKLTFQYVPEDFKKKLLLAGGVVNRVVASHEKKEA